MLTPKIDPDTIKKNNVLASLNKFRIIKWWFVLIAFFMFVISALQFYNHFMMILSGFSGELLFLVVLFFIFIFVSLFLLRITLLNVFGKVFTTPQSLVSKKPEIVEHPSVLFEKLPAWSVNARKPMFVFSDPEKEIVEVVLASERRKWRYIWAVWDPTDLLLSLGKQAYRVKAGITSGVFLLNADTGDPITIGNSDKNSGEERETLDAVHKQQIINFAYSKGKIEGANQLMRSLGLTLILQIICILLIAGSIFIIYTTNKDTTSLLNNIINMVNK